MKRHSISFILGTVITAVAIIFSVVSLVFTPYDPESMDIYNRFQGPSAEHLLGTDHFGRDILSRIMSGSLVALSSALLSVTIGALLGIVIGLVSALSPKYVSSILQRIIDALMAFPTILIALMLVTIAGKGILPSALAVALAIVPVFSRLVYTMILETMEKFGVRNFVFSSSATVYGEPERLPLDEDCRLMTTNPYGTTKLMQEQMLKDLYRADNRWNIALLRYFNPVGAHPSGRIGEDPKGIPNNLMPYVAQVASGKLQKIGVFGNDYPTPDGTGVRDYIHVVDLARGHVAAIAKLREPGVHIYNLGTGNGYSVLDMIHAFEKACGKKLPYEIKPRRAGDVPACYASSKKAEEELGWKAQYDLEDMCRDQWNWQKNNPNGYEN